MKKYKCTICGHIYDEAVEGVKFEDLPDDWVCPLCMAPKSMFVQIEDTPNDNTEFNKSLDNKKENNSTSIESYLKEKWLKREKVLLVLWVQVKRLFHGQIF